MQHVKRAGQWILPQQTFQSCMRDHPDSVERFERFKNNPIEQLKVLKAITLAMDEESLVIPYAYFLQLFMVPQCFMKAYTILLPWIVPHLGGISTNDANLLKMVWALAQKDIEDTYPIVVPFISNILIPWSKGENVVMAKLAS